VKIRNKGTLKRQGGYPAFLLLWKRGTVFAIVYEKAAGIRSVVSDEQPTVPLMICLGVK